MFQMVKILPTFDSFFMKNPIIGYLASDRKESMYLLLVYILAV